jgi:hypothetical protein
MKGCPDIVGILPVIRGWHERGDEICPDNRMIKSPCECAVRVGQFFGIEVKTDKGKLSPDQEAFRDKCSALGGAYIVARRVEDVEKWLKALEK